MILIDDSPEHLCFHVTPTPELPELVYHHVPAQGCIGNNLNRSRKLLLFRFGWPFNKGRPHLISGS
jgi:hypothetical protein